MGLLLFSLISATFFVVAVFVEWISHEGVREVLLKTCFECHTCAITRDMSRSLASFLRTIDV